MKTTRIKIDPAAASMKRIGRIDKVKVDATTDTQIAEQAALDEALAIRDAAKFAQRVRRRK
jgi:putative transcriptional regulator